MKGGDPVATKSAKIAHCIRVEPPRPVLATTAPEVPSDVTFNEMLERAKLVVSKLKSARAMKAEQGSFKPKPSRALAQELQGKCMQRFEEARLTAKKGEMNKTALVLYKEARFLLTAFLLARFLQGSSFSSSLDVLSEQDSEAWQKVVACKTEIENLEQLIARKPLNSVVRKYSGAPPAYPLMQCFPDTLTGQAPDDSKCTPDLPVAIVYHPPERIPANHHVHGALAQRKHMIERHNATPDHSRASPLLPIPAAPQHGSVPPYVPGALGPHGTCGQSAYSTGRG
jgi:hypothetical protein